MRSYPKYPTLLIYKNRLEKRAHYIIKHGQEKAEQ